MKKDSWLYSDSFLKRALAVYGYSLVGGLIIGIPVMIVFVLISLSVASTIQFAP